MTVQLHLGDCLEFMRSLPDGSVDAVITDPPYGVNYADWDATIPPQSILSECLRISSGPVIWFGAARADCVLDFGLYAPPPDRLMIWSPKFTLSHTMQDGMAYRWHPIYIWRMLKQSVIKWDILNDSTECGNWWEHPATKPLSLMKRLASAFGGDTVLDPFMGSGTTGVACVKLGRNFIGCEISSDYFAVAEKRIAEAQLQPALMELA